MTGGSSSNAESDPRTRGLSTAQIALIDFVAGSFGGVGTVLVGQPFDTVKVSAKQSNTRKNKSANHV